MMRTDTETGRHPLLPDRPLRCHSIHVTAGRTRRCLASRVVTRACAMIAMTLLACGGGGSRVFFSAPPAGAAMTQCNRSCTVMLAGQNMHICFNQALGGRCP